MTELADPNRREFLITQGGPTYRIEKRVGLIRENAPRILRRAILCILVTWLPLLILSVMQGYATGHLVPVPFLHDFAVHARFLFTVPLLLLAETVLGPRIAHAARHFIDSGLVLAPDYASFDSAIARGLRSRDSTLAEIVLIFIAYACTFMGQTFGGVHLSTWYALRTSSGTSPTWAGWWFLLFCVPLFQFVAARWLWRLFLWGQFLWRVNHLNLQLVPTHPDGAGGLAFVGESQRYFGMILFAYSITAAGVLANGVFYDKFPLPHFAPAIAVYVIVAVAAVVAPLFVFSDRLLKTKRLGLQQYGTFATEYTSSFHRKWILKPRVTEDVLLGTGDIQSLADLGNSFAFVEKMGAVPMGPRTPIHLALACLIPIAPLLLTMMPLGELLKMLFKVAL